MVCKWQFRVPRKEAVSDQMLLERSKYQNRPLGKKNTKAELAELRLVSHVHLKGKRLNRLTRWGSFKHHARCF